MRIISQNGLMTAAATDYQVKKLITCLLASFPVPQRVSFNRSNYIELLCSAAVAVVVVDSAPPPNQLFDCCCCCCSSVISIIFNLRISTSLCNG